MQNHKHKGSNIGHNHLMSMQTLYDTLLHHNYTTAQSKHILWLNIHSAVQNVEGHKRSILVLTFTPRINIKYIWLIISNYLCHVFITLSWIIGILLLHITANLVLKITFLRDHIWLTLFPPNEFRTQVHNNWVHLSNMTQFYYQFAVSKYAWSTLTCFKPSYQAGTYVTQSLWNKAV